jgi:hypothetical protein
MYHAAASLPTHQLSMSKESLSLMVPAVEVTRASLELLPNEACSRKEKRTVGAVFTTPSFSLPS